MRKFVLSSVLVCVAAFADIDSSVDIPYGKHQKYTLGNQKNHPTIRLEGERYFASLAKLSKDEIKKIITQDKMSATAVSLIDLHQELVYEVYAKDESGKSYKLYIDAGNAKVLEKRAS